MQGSFAQRHQARKVLRTHGILTPVDNRARHEYDEEGNVMDPRELVPRHMTHVPVQSDGGTTSAPWFETEPVSTGAYFKIDISPPSNDEYRYYKLDESMINCKVLVYLPTDLVRKMGGNANGNVPRGGAGSAPGAPGGAGGGAGSDPGASGGAGGGAGSDQSILKRVGKQIEGFYKDNFATRNPNAGTRPPAAPGDAAGRGARGASNGGLGSLRTHNPNRSTTRPAGAHPNLDPTGHFLYSENGGEYAIFPAQTDNVTVLNLSSLDKDYGQTFELGTEEDGDIDRSRQKTKLLEKMGNKEDMDKKHVVGVCGVYWYCDVLAHILAWPRIQSLSNKSLMELLLRFCVGEGDVRWIRRRYAFEYDDNMGTIKTRFDEMDITPDTKYFSQSQSAHDIASNQMPNKVEDDVLKLLPLFVAAFIHKYCPIVRESSYIQKFSITTYLSDLWIVLPKHQKRSGEYVEKINPTEMVDRALIPKVNFPTEEAFRKFVMGIISRSNEDFLSTVYQMHTEETYYHNEGVAFQNDFYYAKAVAGAMINGSIEIIWVPSVESEHSRFDDDKITKAMWDMFTKAMNADEDMRLFDEKKIDDELGDPTTDKFLKKVRQVKTIKRQVKDIWMQSKVYRVADSVNMVEIELLNRLRSDRAFPWLERTQPFRIEPMYLCFLMRRHPALRHQFAAAVGKRMATERLTSRMREPIIAHHRTASWAEQEYRGLHEVVTSNHNEIEKVLREHLSGNANEPQPSPLFYDYSDIIATVARGSGDDSVRVFRT